jgi:hypothetical protein
MRMRNKKEKRERYNEIEHGVRVRIGIRKVTMRE